MNDHSLTKKLETILKKTIIGEDHISNQYGVNQKLYCLTTADKNKYFMKFCRDNTLYEAEAYIKLTSYLPMADLVYSGYLDNQAIIIYSYKEGRLLTDILLEAENRNLNDEFLSHEDNKNRILLNMYEKTKSEVNMGQYMGTKTNTLFYERLLGDRYKEYYLGNGSTLYPLFFRELSLNGKKLGRVIEVINNIKDKYKLKSEMKIDAVLGHGDGHHQNVICDESKNLYFTDFEYSANIPLAMELSKPYYIDLIGTLFFFFENRLLKHFSFEAIRDSSSLVDYDIRLKSYPLLRLAVTENKVNYFKGCLDSSRDLLTLNDYLVLSHLLSRDPNKYSKQAQELFLVMLMLLSRFDPFNPKSLFDFFL